MIKKDLYELSAEGLRFHATTKFLAQQFCERAGVAEEDMKRIMADPKRQAQAALAMLAHLKAKECDAELI